MADEPSRKKRGAENQINKDNWEQEEEGDDGAEVRCAASPASRTHCLRNAKLWRPRRSPVQPPAPGGGSTGAGAGVSSGFVGRAPLSAHMRLS